jgi:hypothetical protein
MEVRKGEWRVQYGECGIVGHKTREMKKVKEDESCIHKEKIY